MSSGEDELTDGVLDDPVRLLGADRPAVRAHIDATEDVESVGREVFQQAEAIFGGAEVPRAEFASWLQFAAKVLGHDAYAERVAAAEPGMPWRTVWAWWRPVGKYVAHPNLTSQDTLTLGRQMHKGRELLHVQAAWEDTWLDLETGVQVPAPPEEARVSLPLQYGAQDVPRLDECELSAPESWDSAGPLVGADGRTRYLVDDIWGLALLETDAAVLRDWPRGWIDAESSEEGTPGRMPFFAAPDGPLTARRVDDAFAPVKVVRIPGHELPATLEHTASRAHLRDVGLPSWWACGMTTFEPCPAQEMTPLADDALVRVELPGGVEASDLLPLGSGNRCGVRDTVYLHRRAGSVHVRENLELVQLSPDLDHFTRVLEGVRRYMSACWYPYPDEDASGNFFREMDALAPGTVDSDGPSGQVWLQFVVGITGLNEDGF
ncbi:SUKH-4 family immunity protein [Streptomyces chattanoogensis]|uniref:SUKH-4 family immunity protein n=1 Tax=Streptomyces chattanoogensis TaxID=66876 RepID=UPI003688959E